MLNVPTWEHHSRTVSSGFAKSLVSPYGMARYDRDQLTRLAPAPTRLSILRDPTGRPMGTSCLPSPVS